MRHLTLATAFALTVSATSVFAADDNTHAGRALNLSGQASAATSGSAAHSIAASGQVTSAAIAVPLAIGGSALTSAGKASTAGANASMNAATAPIDTPLPITDEAITSMPPDQALKTHKTEEKAPAKGI